MMTVTCSAIGEGVWACCRQQKVTKNHLRLSDMKSKIIINVYLGLYINRNSLTGGEATSEEHVEEVFRSDVRLKASVEVKPSSL